MDNLLSLPVMKELLPLLNHCIHDTSEKVRIAFCELLLVVKGMKSIKVFSYLDLCWIYFWVLVLEGVSDGSIDG